MPFLPVLSLHRNLLFRWFPALARSHRGENLLIWGQYTLIADFNRP
jgi:hypothetical protein